MDNKEPYWPNGTVYTHFQIKVLDPQRWYKNDRYRQKMRTFSHIKQV